MGPITDDSGSVNPILLKERIFSSADNLQIDTIYTKLKEISVRYCDTILSSPEMVGSGIQDDSRMACLISLCNDSPTTHEGKLIWLAHHLDCTSSYTSVQSESPTIFPRDNLPNDSLWHRGVNSWSSIKDKKFKESTKNSLISQIELIRHTWESAEGSLILHFAQVAMLIDPNPIRNSPESRKKPLIPFPENIPDRAPSGERSDKFYFPLESEARNLEDLRLVHLGFKGILKTLKERAEVHDFDDIQALAGDLLLSNCPEVCRKFYPQSVIRELDSIGEDPWRDDHIDRAFEEISILEKNPVIAGESASNLGVIRLDLERRLELLRNIRRRYMAFIIDEAQDNSPLQWRLLSRLWGRGKSCKTNPRLQTLHGNQPYAMLVISSKASTRLDKPKL